MKKTFLLFRSVILYLLLTLMSLIWCPLLYLSLPLPFAVRRDLLRAWSRGTLLFLKVICGIDYEIIGKSNIPNQPVIFFSKHQSAWETLALGSILPNNCFVAKKSLLNIPVFGWGMRLGRHIPIDRSAGIQAFKKIVTTGKKRLKDTLSIIIFPEGTRVLPNQHPNFHKSGAALAKSTNALVVPIAHNAGHYWPKNGIIKYPGTIKLVIGKPIDSKSLTTNEINEKTHAWIRQQMQALESDNV